MICTSQARKPRPERKQLAGVAQQVTSQNPDLSPKSPKPYTPGQHGNSAQVLPDSLTPALPLKHLQELSQPAEGLELRCPLFVKLRALPLWPDPLGLQSRGGGVWKTHHTPKTRAPACPLKCLQVFCRCIFGGKPCKD